jgi:hypothetical protein
LLTDLRSNNWASLLILCGFPADSPAQQLRTVGLRDARKRLKSFITSGATEADLDLLIDLRDGVVHAAVNDEVEERVLVAFVHQADAMLADLNKSRADFWADQLDVVDVLVADATDKVRHRVQLALARAKAAFVQEYGGMSDEMRDVIKNTPPSFDERHEAIAKCPACGSKGVATGEVELETEGGYDADGVARAWAFLMFTPETFSCQLCGLRLASQAELAEAGVPHQWVLPGLDASDYLAWDWGEDYG